MLINTTDKKHAYNDKIRCRLLSRSICHLALVPIMLCDVRKRSVGIINSLQYKQSREMGECLLNPEDEDGLGGTNAMAGLLERE